MNTPMNESTASLGADVAYHRDVKIPCDELENLQGGLVCIRELAKDIKECLEAFGRIHIDAENLKGANRIMKVTDEALIRLAQYHPDRRQTDGSDSTS
jgi:hypothetical protein